ncbi:M48 family metallopeptidase [Anaeropeptidivorans aminofermentans]|jgi:hypothetical protein|uniref:M48 family metallopeptidase n=1 Tax=Anaeropeptidivorans aminofermentans TaxID=2934315 RepID=UPI00202421D7|nr:SprT family zinc-dependent metalloprotease [Anaeropeptidivorans aminofermentans]MBE6012762.1 M48 family metallopeptidase [Lachnospiraceae bacterium]
MKINFNCDLESLEGVKFYKRKTIGIYIKADGTVEIRAPYGCSLKAIEDFVNKRKRWIEFHSRKRKAEYEEATNFSFSEGEKISILGKTYYLSKGRTFKFEGDTLLFPEGDIFYVRKQFTKFLKKVMLDELTPLIEKYSEITGLYPREVKVSSAKRRWASCSGRNSLNFSLYLAFGDEYIIEYIIVHELCHIKEKNHSRSFWHLVEEYMPDYNKRKEALRLLEKRIFKEGIHDL